MVYILEFDQALAGRARFYIGSCKDGRLDDRLAEHRAGHGAALTRACNDAGIGFQPVAVFQGQDRRFERRLKNQKNTPRILRQIKRSGRVYGVAATLL